MPGCVRLERGGIVNEEVAEADGTGLCSKVKPGPLVTELHPATHDLYKGRGS